MVIFCSYAPQTPVMKYLTQQETVLLNRYSHIIWFTFYHLQDTREWLNPFNLLVNYVSTSVGIKTTDNVVENRQQMEAHLLTSNILLILDGLEVVQNSNGELREKYFESLLNKISNGHKSQVIITTRVPLLGRQQGRVLYKLSEWNDDDIKDLILGSRTDKRDLSEVIKILGRHPLTLNLFRIYLEENCGRDLAKTTEIFSLIKERLRDHSRPLSSEQQQQNEKVRLIIQELKKVIPDKECEIMNRLSLMWGSNSNRTENNLKDFFEFRNGFKIRKIQQEINLQPKVNLSVKVDLSSKIVYLLLEPLYTAT